MGARGEIIVFRTMLTISYALIKTFKLILLKQKTNFGL